VATGRPAWSQPYWQRVPPSWWRLPERLAELPPERLAELPPERLAELPPERLAELPPEQGPSPWPVARHPGLQAGR
jgi:hypothetical protein